MRKFLFFPLLMEKTNKHRIITIAKRIKELRINSGYTSYEKFAIKHELDRKQYWRMEKGQNFKIESLLRILNIHKITLSEFFEDID